jgi:hypothetical protein
MLLTFSNEEYPEINILYMTGMATRMLQLKIQDVTLASVGGKILFLQAQLYDATEQMNGSISTNYNLTTNK